MSSGGVDIVPFRGGGKGEVVISGDDADNRYCRFGLLSASPFPGRRCGLPVRSGGRGGRSVRPLGKRDRLIAGGQ